MGSQNYDQVNRTTERESSSTESERKQSRAFALEREKNQDAVFQTLRKRRGGGGGRRRKPNLGGFIRKMSFSYSSNTGHSIGADELKPPRDSLRLEPPYGPRRNLPERNARPKNDHGDGGGSRGRKGERPRKSRKTRKERNGSDQFQPNGAKCPGALELLPSSARSALMPSVESPW